MSDHVRELRSELKADAKDFLLSREFLGSVVAGAGAALASAGVLPTIGAIATTFTTITGGAISVGGILGTSGKYAATRAKILEANPMAYLYHSQTGSVQ
jgi:hypothetical protein